MLRHLLSIEGLKEPQIQAFFRKADSFFNENGEIIQSEALKGITLANLFFEPSTRTRSTFELAAKKLSANVLNLDIAHSSASKGESLRDTVRNLEAMQCHVFVIRHPQSGAAHFVAKHVKPHIRIINAGDGCHEHPTQALLDMYTLQKHRGDIKKMTVAIVGDVRHSRVARSQIHALTLLRAQEIRVIGPKTLIPPHLQEWGVSVYHDMDAGLKDVDVIMMLRLQRERMSQGLLPRGNAYFRDFGLTERRLALARPNALVVHPGPINRGVEIDSDVADGPHAVILDQVTNGIAIRMSVIATLMDSTKSF